MHTHLLKNQRRHTNWPVSVCVSTWVSNDSDNTDKNDKNNINNNHNNNDHNSSFYGTFRLLCQDVRAALSALRGLLQHCNSQSVSVIKSNIQTRCIPKARVYLTFTFLRLSHFFSLPTAFSRTFYNFLVPLLSHVARTSRSCLCDWCL